MGGLHENIDEMNRKMQEHQEKYGDYMRQIAKNEPDVVITNTRELGKMENDSTSVITKLKGDVSSL